MDKMLNSKKEKDSIYEIYRACRLCGGGAGYKMPIIQSIVELDSSDVELKQKIRDCVQIEVTQDDKMPPLICELCVDKVNDFYEFLEMCRQTNTRTRLRLGLPPQSLSRGTTDGADCILGLTEPVFIEDSDSEVKPKAKNAGPKSKAKRVPIVKVKVENLQERRSSLLKKRDPTPPRTTRNRNKDDDLPLKNLKVSPQPLKAAPKSILKKESSFKKEEEKEERFNLQRKNESTPVRITRNTSRDDDVPLNTIKSEENKKKRSFEMKVRTETPPKRVKISLKPTILKKHSTETPRSSKTQSLSHKSKTRPTRSNQEKVTVKRELSSPLPLMESICEVCKQSFKTVQARNSHWKTHTVGYTDPKLACNPCGEWFPTHKETVAHHELHKTKPYCCENCYSDFKTLDGFDEHLVRGQCIPSYVAPDVQCDVCWYEFPTYTALYAHECVGERLRPGGKCSKCERSYSLYRNLMKHESTCTARKKGEPIVEPGVMERLKPVEIRLVRCDNLLRKQEQCNNDIGTERYHPYRSQFRKKAAFRGMVKIHDEIKKAFCSQDYPIWDSGESGTDDERQNSNTVHSLVALTLKTIFSQRLIGKVPRKKRRVKVDKVFDLLQTDEDDIKVDISNIIDKLCAEDDDLESSKNGDKNNSKDSDNINDKEKSSNNNDKINDSLETNENNDSLEVNDTQNLLNNDNISKNSACIVNNDINNDSKASPIKYNLNTDEKHHKDSTVIESNNFNVKSIMNDSSKNNDNDIINDILSKTVESKTSLGINDFSFDTI